MERGQLLAQLEQRRRGGNWEKEQQLAPVEGALAEAPSLAALERVVEQEQRGRAGDTAKKGG